VRIGGVCAFAGAIAAASASCLGPTEVTLVISTNEPCGSLTGTAITVGTAADLGNPSSQLQPVAVTNACDPTTGSIGTFVVVPNGNSTESFAIEVAAAVGGMATDCRKTQYKNCIVARREIAFIPHTPLTLPIELTIDCLGVSCSTASGAVLETCQPGKGCVPDTAPCENGICSPRGDVDAASIDAASEPLPPDSDLSGDARDSTVSMDVSLAPEASQEVSTSDGPGPAEGEAPDVGSVDARADASPDVSADVSADAPRDVVVDAQPDATLDGPVDAPVDVGQADSGGSETSTASDAANDGPLGSCPANGSSPGVACNGGHCLSTEVCCVHTPVAGSPTEACTAPGACDITSAGSLYSSLACRNRGDCPTGNVCCVNTTSGSGLASSCTTTCAGITSQHPACQNSCECAAGTCGLPNVYPCANMGLATCGSLCP
jgi:hypothetical protein